MKLILNFVTQLSLTASGRDTKGGGEIHRFNAIFVIFNAIFNATLVCSKWQ